MFVLKNIENKNEIFLQSLVLLKSKLNRELKRLEKRYEEIKDN